MRNVASDVVGNGTVTPHCRRLKCENERSSWPGHERQAMSITGPARISMLSARCTTSRDDGSVVDESFPCKFTILRANKSANIIYNSFELQTEVSELYQQRCSSLELGSGAAVVFVHILYHHQKPKHYPRTLSCREPVWVVDFCMHQNWTSTNSSPPGTWEARYIFTVAPQQARLKRKWRVRGRARSPPCGRSETKEVIGAKNCGSTRIAATMMAFARPGNRRRGAAQVRRAYRMRRYKSSVCMGTPC